MEHNENNNGNVENNDFFKKDDISLKERGKGNSNIWYLVIGLLILGLFAWYGYTVGWFSKDVKQQLNTIQDKVENSTTPFGSSDGVKASISNVMIKTSEDFPVKKTLVIKGELDNNCTYLNGPQAIRDGSTFYVNLTTRKEDNNCVDGIIEYEKDIDLEVVGLPAGVYSVIVNGIKTTFELEQDNVIDFSSGEEK